MASNPSDTVQQETRPVQIYLREDEVRMLDELRSADVRTISDTMRFALRQAHAARFGQQASPVQDAQS